MPQVSLYLSDDEMLELKEQAGRANLSLSAFTRKLINENATKSHDVQGWWKDVAGKLDDKTFTSPEDHPLDVNEIQAWA